ncbi:inner membrane protein [Escherichia coli]|uniref:Inner membrane protein n=1 Tax=Escherichia coli TaxID=562 RepID=A0A376WXT3_ECOLX|nr:inner membrane protein [Escherichia coli]
MWEKCDFYHIIVLSLNFPGYLKMEYGSTKMEERTLSQSWWQTGFVGFLYMVWLFRLGNGALHLGDEPDPRCPRVGI